MSNDRRSTPPQHGASREEYPVEALRATPGLSNGLRERIRRSGPLPFSDFMAAALYDPDHGYYARRASQVGREGDFFTSVSAGPLFGRLLAAHLAAWWRKNGQPSPWRILELGAHDAALATDILGEMQANHPEAFAALHYTILEPLDHLASTQRAKLASFPRIHIHPDPAGLPPLPGLLIANEVLDALPCHLIESDGSRWLEIGVGLDPSDQFIWQPLGPASRNLTAHLPQRPVGYRSEVRPGLAAFLKPLAALLAPGHMVWIDYGFERDDYYAEARTAGTLRTFHRHRAGEDPLDSPGERDITAHVDFTALHEAVEQSGGRVVNFENQSRFLTRTATPWLLSLEGRSDPRTMKLMRNFQTLTHPGQLGSRFHILEAAWPAP